VCRQCESNREFKGTVILRGLCYYLIRKPSYPGENCAMPPRLRYFVYFLDFEMDNASRGPPCDSAAPCLKVVILHVHHDLPIRCVLIDEY